MVTAFRRKSLVITIVAAVLGVGGLLASPAGGATAGVITISPPGTQNNYAGDSVYLKLNATDSVPGATLTYSLNAVPDGLSLNPATGVVSGRVTDLGGAGFNLTLTVTGSDGATATASLAWNVTSEFLETPLGQVRSAYPGMCLDDKGNSTATGNPIQLAKCDGSSGEWVTWTGNTLRILGKCVDDPGSSIKQGTPLRLAPCTGGGSQNILQFGSELTFFPGQIGVGCIDAPHPAAGTRLVLGTTACPAVPGPAPAGKCLSVRGGATATGSVVDVYPCTSGDTNQQWLQLPGDLLRNTRSGKCLAFPGALPAAGVSLVIKPCSSALAAGQGWHLI